MGLRPSSKMGKIICAKSSISYLTTAPSEFETFKLSLMAVALAYRASVTLAWSGPYALREELDSTRVACAF